MILYEKGGIPRPNGNGPPRPPNGIVPNGNRVRGRPPRPKGAKPPPKGGKTPKVGNPPPKGINPPPPRGGGGVKTELLNGIETLSPEEEPGDERSLGISLEGLPRVDPWGLT